jgi:hypothetical protein
LLGFDYAAGQNLRDAVVQSSLGSGQKVKRHSG